VRADIFVPGPHGQGQYVRFDDKYISLRSLNGAPNQVDHPFAGANIANYESSLGVVFWVKDPNGDGILDDNEDIFGIIATTIYPGKTTKGIGIGSSYQALRAAYGAPDTIYFDTTSPAAWYMDYGHLGLYFYGNANDTSVIQMEGYEVLATPVPNSPTKKTGSSTTTILPGQKYRLRFGR
jgi:hypothetical protein